MLIRDLLLYLTVIIGAAATITGEIALFEYLFAANELVIAGAQ